MKKTYHKIHNKLSQKIHPLQKSLKKNKRYTVILFAGLVSAAMGVMTLLFTPQGWDPYILSIVTGGASFIIASVVGFIMASQTDEITASLHKRFDKQDELAELRHKKVMDNHNETVSILLEIVDKLDALGKSIDNMSNNMSKSIDNMSNNMSSKLDKLDSMNSKLDKIIDKIYDQSSNA